VYTEEDEGSVSNTIKEENDDGPVLPDDNLAALRHRRRQKGRKSVKPKSEHFFIDREGQKENSQATRVDGAERRGWDDEWEKTVYLTTTMMGWHVVVRRPLTTDDY
jgi:hypothetical protein